MTTTTGTTFSVGDTVHITRDASPRWAGTYDVAKVNRTTLRLVGNLAPNGLKPPMAMVSPGPMPTAGTAAAVEPPEVLQPGTVVRLIGVRNVDPDALYVVTGQAPRGARVFPLGGSDRYYTGIAASRMKRVDRIDGWTARTGVATRSLDLAEEA